MTCAAEQGGLCSRYGCLEKVTAHCVIAIHVLIDNCRMWYPSWLVRVTVVAIN